jgi:hypothetical protein
MFFYGQDNHKSGSSIIADLSRRIKPINLLLCKEQKKPEYGEKPEYGKSAITISGCLSSVAKRSRGILDEGSGAD